MTDTPKPTLAQQIAWLEDCLDRAKSIGDEEDARLSVAVLATLHRVERMEAVVKAARQAVAAIQSARPSIDAAVIRLSVANHLMSRLAALDAAAPETETVTDG